MYRKLKTLTLALLALFAFSESFSQDVLNIADEGDHSVPCDASLIITDSGGENGNYGPNETYQITLCVDAGSESNPQVIISPDLFGDIWDVDDNSSLFVYNGADASAPLLGQYNSSNAPAGINIQGDNVCLTLVFVSGSASTGAGFTAHFSCFQPLQDFNFTLTGIPPIEPFQDLSHEAIQICFGDSISLHTETDYPLSDAEGNGYHQEDATSLFRYLMGDGTIYQGLGLTDITHTYTNPFGYLVTVIITDVNGKVETEQIYVLISPRPDFSNLAVEDTLCIGAETEITGGIFEGDTVGVSPSNAAILGGGILGEQIYLPDGDDNLYETSINIDEFDDDQVIENVSDIVNFCVNMEHSFLGDLEMGLTCPDGTQIIIFNSYNNAANVTQMFPGGFGGGGTFLGDANDGFPDGVPGIGFDYCFSDDAGTGTFEDVFDDPTYLVDVTQGTAIVGGSYIPEESFADLIGCPINGDWTLSVKDNWSSDDGFIFNWSIYFDPNINPSTVYYSPNIDSVYWEDNADIIANNGTTITVKPSEEGNNSFTFVVIDEFGCIHDTVVDVYVRPHIVFPDAIACDLFHIAAPSNSPDGGVYTTLTTPTPSASLEYVPIIEGLSPDSIFANEYGVYTIDFTENNCGYADTASIDFRPDPQIQAFIDSTVLCIGASLTLDAGPQQPNSDNFSIVWTDNGNVFNTSDYSVTIDETGYYVLTITGVCGTATDATDLVAIELSFEGDTVCGLQANGSVDLAPMGTGLWTANSTDISFSAANQLNTQISSSKYGLYPITFTDTRCPEDGVTHDFRFVEQPEASIIPQFPDFCIDSDSLVLTATVNGSNKGIYIWTVNGTAEPTQENILRFGPNPDAGPGGFLPLEDYLIEVLVQDAFGVCPLATGAANFTGKWCEYNIPNVFTPNGDGMNDKFHVQYIEYFPGTKLTIYDRWGKHIFEQNDYDKYQQANGGWDPGDQAAGTYFYELLIPQVNKKETGYVEILKKDSDK